MTQTLAHAITAARVAAGAAAIEAALAGSLSFAAALITASAVLDGLDGKVARWSGATGPFGALFDYFCDYLSFLVAPWILTRALVGDAAWPVRAAIALPLLTGAIRYARNGTAVAAQEVELRDLPGLGTVFYAFVPVVAVFLDAPLSVPAVTLTFLLCVASALFAVLMLAPVKYPKLSLFPGASPAVLILLAAMPLVGTKIIAAAALLIGSAYVIGGPFALRRVDPARSGDARGDR